jgi:ABC-type sugar transport system permease subunit/ABC-type glycerol-3-phosphate transport system substrate-binding protein
VQTGSALLRAVCLIFALLVFCRPACADNPIHIELALQEGGERPETFGRIVAAFEASHPGIVVDADSDPRITDKLRVRTLSKDFPEITNGDFGGWHMIQVGDVLPLDDALDAPLPPGDDARVAIPGVRTWRESFLPGTLDRFRDARHTYAVPLSYYAQSIWFNQRMFTEHSWPLPATWDQLLRLCATIKSTGIAPFAFQGRYPEYAHLFLYGAYYQLAGAAAFDAEQRIEPGCFDNPQMIQALTWTQTLATHYFQKGALGMGHTEAQLQFFLGHTAMIPCGSWLKSEMAGKIPDGFELGTFNLPSVPGGKGDPTAVLANSGYYTVFSHSRHPAEAVTFLRFLTSPTMAAMFCHDNDIPVAVRGANEGNLSPDLADLGRIVARSRATYSESLGDFHPGMSQVQQDVLSKVLAGTLTPPAAARELESAATAVRLREANPDLVPVRHRIAPVVLLALLAGGLLYAAGDGLRRVVNRRGGSGAGASASTLRGMSWGHVLLFVGPAAALFAAFALLPACKGFLWSLQQWDGLTDAHFVGLRQFRYLLLQSDGFWIALRNNLFIMLVIPLFMVPLALFLAACVSRGVRGGKVFRSTYLLPSVMGGVATTILWMNLYDPQAGVVNMALAAVGRGLAHLGLGAIGAWFAGFDGFAWLSEDHLYTALVPMSVWAGFGFNFVLYLAAMESVPGELYEAAELDGATAWQQFRIVTLPLIWEVLTVSIVFLVIGGMKAFDTIWLLTNQSPGTAVHVIGTLMVRTMFTDMHVGEATAIAVLMLGMVFVASVVAMRVMKREAIER